MENEARRKDGRMKTFKSPVSKEKRDERNFVAYYERGRQG